MKKLLYISIIATLLFSCKKEKEEGTNETNNTQTCGSVIVLDSISPDHQHIESETPSIKLYGKNFICSESPVKIKFLVYNTCETLDTSRSEIVLGANTQVDTDSSYIVINMPPETSVNYRGSCKAIIYAEQEGKRINITTGQRFEYEKKYWLAGLTNGRYATEGDSLVYNCGDSDQNKISYVKLNGISCNVMRSYRSYPTSTVRNSLVVVPSGFSEGEILDVPYSQCGNRLDLEQNRDPHILYTSKPYWYDVRFEKVLYTPGVYKWDLRVLFNKYSSGKTYTVKLRDVDDNSEVSLSGGSYSIGNGYYASNISLNDGVYAGSYEVLLIVSDNTTYECVNTSSMVAFE